jgi:hypothetical protein
MRLVVRVAGRTAGVAALAMTGALVATLTWAISIGSGQLLGTLPSDAVNWGKMLGGMAMASVVALGSVWRAFSLNWRTVQAKTGRTRRLKRLSVQSGAGFRRRPKG